MGSYMGKTVGVPNTVKDNICKFPSIYYTFSDRRGSSPVTLSPFFGPPTVLYCLISVDLLIHYIRCHENKPFDTYRACLSFFSSRSKCHNFASVIASSVISLSDMYEQCSDWWSSLRSLHFVNYIIISRDYPDGSNLTKL